MNAQLLKGTVDLLTLAVLAGHSRHGYDIAKELRNRTGNLVDLKQGTLYPTLHRLAAGGFIVGSWVEQRGYPSRFVYEITTAGLDAFTRRRAEWDDLSLAVARVLDDLDAGVPA